MYQLPNGKSNGALLQESMREDEFAKLFGALRRRWRAFVAIFGVFFCCALLYALFVPKKYITTVEVITGNSSAGNAGTNSELPVLNALISASGVQSVETYATMIQDKALAASVIEKLHLKTSAYNLLKYNVSVLPVTGTQIINLNVMWPDAEESAKIANEFATELMAHQRDLIAGQSVSAMNYLNQQLPIAQAKMNQADAAFAAFQAKHTLADVSSQTQEAVSRYSDVDARIAGLEVDLNQNAATLANIQGQMAANARTSTGGTNIAQNPVVTQLQQQLATVSVELAAARKQYTEAHPTVTALEQQQALLKQEIARQPATYTASNTVVPNPVYQQLDQQSAQLRSQMAGDQAQLDVLRRQQSALASNVRTLPAVSQQYANLQREATLADGVYQTLKQHYNDAFIAKTIALSDVSIDQPADKKFATVVPSLPLTMALGLILGLMLGLSGVFIIDFFDTSLKDENDVRRELPAPILASVPQLESGSGSKRSQERLSMLRALTIEAYLQLVTALRFSSDKPLRTLAVTSPLQGDGKSTVALSTAVAMAELRPRVLLIDADLRRPTLHEKLGVGNAPGLTDILVEGLDPSEAIKTTRFAGLDLLTSGTSSPNPIRLLQSPRFDELLAKLNETYQIIILDTPSLLPLIDATVIAAKTDGTVIVIAAGKTDARAATRAFQRLMFVEGPNVLGIVLNRTTPNARESGYFLPAASELPITGELESV
jgi:capsular exopolysaccharide synthesis family protein